MLLAASAALLVLTGMTGCAVDRAEPRPGATASDGWSSIPLPAKGARVLVLLGAGDRMLALGSRPTASGREPAAWSTPDLRRWTALTIHPVTGYGRVAELVKGAVTHGRVVAYGQAFGGAHSNPRPTVWNGTLHALTEHEQPFTMFGGEDALDVAAEAADDRTALLVGSWLGMSGRYGATVWRSASGTTWRRYADLASLASAPGEQTSAAGVAASTHGFVVTGASQHNTGSGPPSTALAWISGDGSTWSRIALPAAESAVASRAACTATACVVIGSTLAATQHALCWSLDNGGRVIAASEGPGEGLVEATQVVAAADRAWAVVDVDRVAHAFAIDQGCTDWHEITLPGKAETAVLNDFHGRLVLAETGSEDSRLWVRTAQ